MGLAALPAAAQAASPANDDFANAQTVRIGDRVTGTTAESTLQAGEPAPASAGSGSIWYRVTAGASETLRVDSCGSPSYAEILVYTGAAVGALTPVTTTATSCNGGGRAYFAATAATTYYVRLAGWAAATAGTELNVARPKAPANDNFAQAEPLGQPARITASNVDATVEAGEPDINAPNGGGSKHSVWYRLTAATAGTVIVSTCSGGADALVGVYTGTSVGGLTAVSGAGDVCNRTRLVFDSVVGRTYHILVESPGDSAGDFTLEVSAPDIPRPISHPPPPPAPTCPFALAGGDLLTYSGKHEGGGAVCLTVSKDFSGVVWFHALEVPGYTPRGTCTIPWSVERMELETPIVDRRFSYGTSLTRVIGSLSTGRTASGTMRMTLPVGGSMCHSAELKWTATTTATPPWLDTTAPALRLSATTAQRPLRKGSITLLVKCPKEACAASASATVAGVRLKSSKLAVRRGTAGRTLRLALSGRAKRAIGSALRSRSSIRTRVTVVAIDEAGNRSSARRMITLRR